MSRLTDFLSIRQGEGLMASLLIGVMLLTAGGAALGGTGIEALFFARFGVDYLPYMFFGLGLMNMFTSFGISAALGRVSRSLLYIYLPIVLAAVLVLAWLALLTKWSGLYPILWLGKEILNMLIGVLIWGLANMACDTRQAKRLFPLFNASRILGSVIGGFATGAMVTTIGTENLLLVWAAAMLGTYLLSYLLVRSQGSTNAYARPPRRKRLTLREEIKRGYRHVRGSGLLRWIALASILLSVLYFSISLPFSRAVTERYPNENQLAAFLGTFNGLSTAAAFLASLFLANRLFARYGIMTCLFFFTCMYLAGFAGLALLPVFAIIVFFRFVQMLSLSGIADPAYQAMFNIIPSDRRDQARTFIDGIPAQAGTMIAGLILIVGEQTLEPRQLYLVGLAAAGLCAFVIWQARRGYNLELVQALQAGRQTFFLSEQRPFGGYQQDAATAAAALNGLRHPDATIRYLSLEILAHVQGPEVVREITLGLKDTDALVRAAAVRALAEARPASALHEITAALRDPEPEVRLEAVSALSEFVMSQPALKHEITVMLEDPDARVSTRAALCLINSRRSTRGKKAREVLQAEKLLYDLAARSSEQERLNAIAALGGTGDPQAFDFLSARLRRGAGSSAIRNAILTALADLDIKRALPDLVKKLGDDDPAIRLVAARLIGRVGGPALQVVLPALTKEASRDGALLALEALPAPPQREPILDFIRAEVQRAQEYDGMMRRVRAARPKRDKTAMIHDPNGLLVEALRYKSFEFGTRAVRAFGLLTDRANITLAVEQLQSPDPGRRAAALEMIDSFDARWNNMLQPLINLWEDQGSVSGGPDWERLLEDEDAWVRTCAVFAARQVEGRRLQTKVNAVLKGETDPFLRDAGRLKGKKMKTNSTLSLMDRILFLKRVPIFADLPPNDLKQVAVIAQEASFQDGEVLAEEGEQGDELFVIVEGQVVVTTAGAGGQVMELARRGPGEYVGEMSIINREPRMASLAASGNTYALTIDQRSFEGLLRERPDVGLAVIRELSSRLRKNTDLLEQLAGQNK
jgi:HEAT repeat protein